MATGVDAAAGIVALITFSLGAAKICVSGAEVLLQARNSAIDIDLHRSRLELDKLRLMDWASAMQDALSDPMSPKRGLDWMRIKDTFAQLEVLLTNTSTLEKTYHFDLDPEIALDAGTFKDPSPRPRTYFGRMVQKFRPDIRLNTAQNIQNKTNVWTQARWVVSGKTRLKELIADIEKLIDQLFNYTDQRDLQFLVRATQHLLRESISRTSNGNDLSLMNQMLGSASSQQTKSLLGPVDVLGVLRARRLALGVDITGCEQEASIPALTQKPQRGRIPRNVRLKGGEYQTRAHLSGDREHGLYQGNPVLLEWKRIPRGLAEKLRYRIEALGLLLHEAAESEFGNLPCLGFFEDIGSDRYGFVYNLPLTQTIPLDPAPNILTLSEILTDKHYPQPTFAQRMSLAASLARYIRELHTVGWLHKAVLSSNVIFLFDSSGSASGYTRPYLAGYGYARAANPTEFSETLDATPEVSIYCHPDSLSAGREPYRKTFDVFSLGMTIIEIGLWRPLWEIFSDGITGYVGNTAQDIVNRTMARRQEYLEGQDSEAIMAQLGRTCPVAYTEAVKLCIWPEKLEGVDDLEESIVLQSKVLDKLESCCALVVR